MEKRNRIIYWTATGLLSLMMLVSAGMYFIDTDQVSDIFVKLGYHPRIVIPLAVLKVLGVVAIVSNKSKILKEWAYFGFLIDFLLALEAHLYERDGGHATVLAALSFWLISYIYGKRAYGGLK